MDAFRYGNKDEINAILEVFGDDAFVLGASAFLSGKYTANGIPVSVDIRDSKTYYKAFYEFYDYADVGAYRVYWDKDAQEDIPTEFIVGFANAVEEARPDARA